MAPHSRHQRSEYERQHRRTNPGRYRKYELKRRFGLSIEQYDEMFLAQDGVCACCGQPERGKRNGKLKWLAVDHDHVAGNIRGLLCSNCNPMLGYAGDRPEILRMAAEYLERSRQAESGDNIVALQKKEN